MFDESGEMSSEIHYNMLGDMVGFIMDRYKESINKGENRAPQPKKVPQHKKVPKNFLNRILGKIERNDY